MTSGSINQFGGSWTEGKLRILEGYLNAYTTALKDQNFHLTYVDAFAGTGYVNPDSMQSQPIWGDELDDMSRGILQGSTRRAIAIDNKPFGSFVFVEQNPEYATALHRMRLEFPDREIRIEQTDANAFLQMWCDVQNRLLGVPWNKPGSRQRAVVFLDPFATQVEWQTVASIAGTQSIDLWILFPLSAITRVLPRNRQPNEAYAATLDRIYGGEEWRTLYQSRIQRTLFGDEMETIRQEQDAIVEVYLDKLRSVFPAVSPSPKRFYNSRSSPLFAFMFAAANPARGGQIALNIANHLLEHW